jgi:Xaa-Pro aminopeptidase
MKRDIKERRRTLLEELNSRDALLLFTSREKVRSNDTLYDYRPDSDFLYLSEFPEPEAAVLLLPGHSESEFVLFVRPRNEEREIWDGFRFGPEGAEQRFDADAAYSIEDFDEKLVELLEGRERLFYPIGEDADRDRRIFRLLKKLRGAGRKANRGPTTFSDPRTLLHAKRRIKSREEVERIEAAAECSAYAHRLAMREVRPGMMEYEVQALMEHEMKRLGASGPSYSSIVAGGSNACVLHYIDNRETLREGDLVLIDAGAEVNWYAGDITRTFPVGATFSNAQRELYEAVLEVQKDAIDRCRSGVTWKEHHDETRRQLCHAMVTLGLLKGKPKELIEEDEDRAFFMHGTGHYLGLDVHDVGPYAVWDADEGEQRELPFEPGVVLTIEPGIYVSPDNEDAPDRFRGIGIRIEDDIVVTDEEPMVLTAKVPKEIDEIEALRAEAFEKE